LIDEHSKINFKEKLYQHHDLLVIVIVTFTIITLGVLRWSGNVTIVGSYFSQAIAESKRLESDQQRISFLLAQGNQFLDNQDYEDAYIVAHYVLEHLESGSVDANQIIQSVEDSTQINKRDLLLYMLASRFEYF